MISLQIGECKVDILPVVSGLVSEADKVDAAFGKYEAYGISLGIEGVEAVRRRTEIPDENYEISDIDIVYAERMSYFGEMQVPSPAFCRIVDLCTERNAPLVPLDMKDEDFDTAYMDCVSAIQFTNQHRLAKKGMKANLDMSSPEAMAKSWDSFIAGHNKGLHKLDLLREVYIAGELTDTAKYRKSLLAVIECERVDGIVENLRNGQR